MGEFMTESGYLARRADRLGHQSGAYVRGRVPDRGAGMTSQSRADALLAAWQLLRLQGVAPELRLPVIDALCEIERTRDDWRTPDCDVPGQVAAAYARSRREDSRSV